MPDMTLILKVLVGEIVGAINENTKALQAIHVELAKTNSPWVTLPPNDMEVSREAAFDKFTTEQKLSDADIWPYMKAQKFDFTEEP